MTNKRTTRYLASGILLSGILLMGCEGAVTPEMTSEEAGILRLQISQTEETLVDELKPHPFNIEFKTVIREYEEADDDTVLQLDARQVAFDELDIVAFYEQVLKDSTYDFAEIRVTENEGLIIYAETGLIGYNPVTLDTETDEWFIPSSTSGVINKDCTITYSDSIFNDENLLEFVQNVDYNIVEAFADYYLEVVIDVQELDKFESVSQGMARITRDLIQTLQLNPNYLSLYGLDVYFADQHPSASEGEVKGLGEIVVTKEKMVSIDWTNEEESLKVLENLINIY